MSERKGATRRARETAQPLGQPPPDVTVGIRELRDHLSRYLELVKGGAAVTITDHGNVIATIVPMTFSQHALELAAQGKVRLPTRPPGVAADFERVEVAGGIADLLDEARG
jgi:antitoxin (DNA-binding transcriptional repressor) of toxin-antitoxin stability system